MVRRPQAIGDSVASTCSFVTSAAVRAAVGALLLTQGMEGFVDLRIRLPEAWAYAQTAAALLLVLGLLTRLAALAVLVLTLSAAMYAGGVSHWASFVLLAALSLDLAVKGGGRLTLDAWLEKRRAIGSTRTDASLAGDFSGLGAWVLTYPSSTPQPSEPGQQFRRPENPPDIRSLFGDLDEDKRGAD